MTRSGARDIGFALCVWVACVGASACGPVQRGSLEPADAPGRSRARKGDASQSGEQPPAEGLPQVQDRDPEQERRKMALSRERSKQAKALLAQARFDEAALQAREALRIHEQNIEAMLVLAEMFLKQGKYELTQTVTSSALAVDAKVSSPAEVSQAYNLKGFAYLAAGDEQLATQAFRKAADTDANNVAAWNNLGARYLEGGDVETALQVFRYVLELDPKLAKGHLNLGCALRGAKRWQEARQAFDRALALRPDYPEAHFNLGLLYLDATDYPGIDLVTRLNTAIGHFTRYRDLAMANQPKANPSKAQPHAASKRGGVESAPPAIGIERADEYIAAAKKGLERESKRRERDQKRKERDASSPATGSTEPAATDSPAPTPPPPPPSPESRSPLPPQPPVEGPGAPRVQSPSPKIQRPSTRPKT